MILIETKRLIIRKAKNTDSDKILFYHLWNSPEVMQNVGFPKGLQISQAEIAELLTNQSDSFLDSMLVVEIKENGELIGEAKLGKPNEKNMAHTDIKLLPEFWGQKYGIEIKKALVSYLFENTEAVAIEATPNVKNIASVKMQESINAKRIKKAIFHFPETGQKKTESVEFYLYRIERKDWKK
jgi:RimJ/RimL family protein N-acetyltransferase